MLSRRKRSKRKRRRYRGIFQTRQIKADPGLRVLDQINKIRDQATRLQNQTKRLHRPVDSVGGDADYVNEADDGFEQVIMALDAALDTVEWAMEEGEG
jgi:hypothetical protein